MTLKFSLKSGDPILIVNTSKSRTGNPTIFPDQSGDPVLNGENINECESQTGNPAISLDQSGDPVFNREGINESESRTGNPTIYSDRSGDPVSKTGEGTRNAVSVLQNKRKTENKINRKRKLEKYKKYKLKSDWQSGNFS